MGNSIDPGDRGCGWRMFAVGILLVVAGVAGTAYAWFPPPPHSTAAPLSGWPARWFAAGIAWFGLVVGLVGVAGVRGRSGRAIVKTGRGALVLAIACWTAFLISLIPR